MENGQLAAWVVRDIDGLEMFLHWCHSENLKIEHEILKVPCYAKFLTLHISCPDSHDKEKKNKTKLFRS